MCELYAQNNINDSLKIYPVKQDTNTVAKLPELFETNAFHGKIHENSENISAKQIPFINYYTINEILFNNEIFYPLDLGVAGNSTAFSVFGALPVANQMMVSTNNHNNLFYGAANYNSFSPEFIGNIELLTGMASAVLGGSAGATTNIQPPIYNISKPYTKIWYNQGDYKHIAIDGIFSQNFLPNWNFTAGFRSMFSDGSYDNSNVKSWNIRAMLKYNLSKYSTASLMYLFENYGVGDFGGIAFEQYNTNDNMPNLVATNFTDLHDRQYRNDVILSYSSVTSDTNLVLNANLFFTNNENNIFWENEKKLIVLDSSGKDVSSYIVTGANAALKYKFLDNFSLDLGSELSYYNMPTTILTNGINGLGYSLFALADYEFKFINVSTGMRYENLFDKNLLSFGVKINFNLSENSKIFADFSTCETKPMPIFNYRNEKHNLAILGIETDYKQFEVNANLFFRQINNPVLLKFNKDSIYTFTPVLLDISQQNLYGVAGKINLNLTNNMKCAANLQSYFDDENDNLNTYLSLLLQYTYTKGTSIVSGGISGTMLFNNKPFYYNPLFKAYSYSDIYNKFCFNGFSAFISAKLGNAFVRMNLNNIMNDIIGNNISYLAYYPLQSREFCLSVTWAFY